MYNNLGVTYFEKTDEHETHCEQAPLEVGRIISNQSKNHLTIGYWLLNKSEKSILVIIWALIMFKKGVSNVTFILALNI